MAAITNYATLVSAIREFVDRDDWDVDQIIGLAEAEFRLHLSPQYARETSDLSLAFTSGSASIPSGFVRPLALSHATYGTLVGTTIGNVRNRRIPVNTGIPEVFAITGSTIEVAPLYTGDLTLDYEATLAGLSSLNATNWLITNAPQAYLSMCMYFGKARDEDPQVVSYRAQAMTAVDALIGQSTVAQYGRASAVLPGATP